MLIFKSYLYQVFSTILDLYYIGFWIYIVSSFFQFDRSMRWYRFLEALMAPPLRWVRKLTQGRAQIGMFDLSPMLIILIFPVFRMLLAWIFQIG